MSDEKVVWQSVECGEWFAATIMRANPDGSFAIDFGDGDIDPAASRESVRLSPPSTDWFAGAAVECKFAGKLTWTRCGASARQGTGVAARSIEERAPAESDPRHHLLAPRAREEAEADAAPAHKRVRETDAQMIPDLFVGSAPSANETRVAMLPEFGAVWQMLCADGRLTEARAVFRPVIEFMARAGAPTGQPPAGGALQRVEL